MKNCYHGQQIFQKNVENQRKNKTAKRRSKFSQGTRYLPLTLDLSSFNISKVNDIEEMFYDCKKLTAIYISDKWKTNSVIYSDNMFKKCYSLPNFSQENTDIEMAKPVEEGGYLTLKN